MSDKFSLYQTDGLWGIIENASNEKQTSIKSYFGSDLIIKRLNEQADQINQLKQQNEELMLQLNRQNVEEHKPVYCTLAGTECEYLGKVEELKQQLAKKDKEIEKLNKTLEMCKHIERYDIGEMFLENAKLIIEKRQFAIQELEKVKEEMDLNGNSYCEIRQGTSPHNPTDYAWFNYVKFRNYLNQQIKELKGDIMK